MYCTNCGKQIPIDSLFCPFCGNKTQPREETPEVQDKIDSLVNDKDRPIDYKNLKEKPLKDIFVTIHDAKDESERYFNAYTSPAMWELLNRLGNNTFEGFISDNKINLNPLPYEVLETLKTTFTYIVHWGYWVHLSKLFQEDKAKKPVSVDIDTIVKEWGNLIGTQAKDFDKKLSDEENNLMNFMLDLTTSVTDKASELKKAPYELIENIKSQLAILLIWGYIAGIAEKKYRK